MDANRTRIRDTSGQDRIPAAPSPGRRRLRDPRLVAGLAGAVLLGLAAWIAVGWSSGGRSHDAARLRIAEVVRGDLVRDLSADGRVIAANSPTLYAIAGGTVALKVVAGDAVEQGQELAVIDSPELRSRLVQEESTLASLQGEANRAMLDARLTRSDAQKLLDQALIDQVAAQRDVERYKRAFEGGAVSRNDYDRALDGLKKAEIGVSAARQDFALQGQGAGIDAENKRLLAERQKAVVDELRRQVDALTLLRALAGSVASYRDGDYSFGVSWEGGGELGRLVDSHRALGDTLRDQRLRLVQRELLLDTMVQNTPVAMLLVDPSGHVVLGNLAARRLLGEGRKLEGTSFSALLDGMPEPMRDAFARGGDGMFTVGHEDDEDIYHLSWRLFRLNGRRHELVLLRQLTAELRRQEVQVWKKVIRVISHELNNSLAPIASLAHSGAELLRRGQHERLPAALATIEERARHLEGFIRDYARFAKLPAPRLAAIEWRGFLERLRSQVDFMIEGHVEGHVRADAAQLEQAMLNLLKNAHESGSAAQDVRLALRRLPDAWRVDVLDRGSGMNEPVLANALLPFYSTKRHGTGLGLALSREIAEAHGGRIALANREGGGLCVSLVLPA